MKDDGTYTIAALHSTRVLNVTGASFENDAAIIQFGWGHEANERFCILDEGEGYVKIVSNHSGKVLTVNENSYVVRGFDNQRFKLIDASYTEQVRVEYDKLSILSFSERDSISDMKIKLQVLWLFYSNVKSDKVEHKMTTDEKTSC